MPKKLSLPEKEYLKVCSEVAHRLLYEFFANGGNRDNIPQKLRIFVIAENNLKNIWKQQMIEEMTDKRLTSAPAKKLFYQTLQPRPNYNLLLSVSKQKQSSDPQVKIYRRCLVKFLHKRRIFNRNAYEMLQKNRTIADVMDFAREHERREQIYEERCLYVIQNLNHIEKMRSFGFEPTTDELRVTFNPECSDDEDIQNELGKLMMSIYVPQQANQPDYAKKKNIIYDYIFKSVKLSHKIHPHYIEFAFKGGWISELTYNCFYHAYPLIKEAGMSPLVLMPIEKLYHQIDMSKNKPDVDQQSAFTDSEKYVMSLYRLYSK